MTLDSFDFLIIGAGAAGCVLANRLSASGRYSVALVEAGSDFASGAEPPIVQDLRVRSMFNPAYMWPDLDVELCGERNGLPPTRGTYLHGRVIGGGSSVNGIQMQRGFAADYDEMATLGATGWDWNGVLPYFRKLENDPDFDSDEHGQSGPIPVKRFGAADLSAFERAVQAAWVAQGHEDIGDLKAAHREGFGALPLNADAGGRASAAKAYLTPEVRRRKNLLILTDMTATHLLYEGLRVVGAEFEGAGGRRSLSAIRTIISAGAIMSPALLMRSGLGPADRLRAKGIDVVHDLPGVGANLIAHTIYMAAAYLDRAGRSHSHMPPVLTALRYSSHLAACPPGDMSMIVYSKGAGPASWDRFLGRLGSMMVLLTKPFSRGMVDLDADKPNGSVDVKFGLLDDDRDRLRIEDGFERLRAVLTHSAVAGLIDSPFFPSLSGSPLRSGAIGTLSSLITSAAFDSSHWLRLKLIRKVGLLLSDAPPAGSGLTEWLRPQLSAGHAVGTCRMGSPTDRGAVTTNRCSVIGVDGLHVVDASLFPAIMRGGSHIPTIMAAEKAADMLLEDVGQ